MRRGVTRSRVSLQRPHAARWLGRNVTPTKPNSSADCGAVRVGERPLFTPSARRNSLDATGGSCTHTRRKTSDRIAASRAPLPISHGINHAQGSSHASGEAMAYRSRDTPRTPTQPQCGREDAFPRRLPLLFGIASRSCRLQSEVRAPHLKSRLLPQIRLPPAASPPPPPARRPPHPLSSPPPPAQAQQDRTSGATA